MKSVQGNTSSSDTIAAAVLLSLINSGKAPLIFDVRSGREFIKGHLPGAIHVPFFSAFWKAKGFLSVRDRSIIVYCAYGPRAVLARVALRRVGFSDVLLLEQHMSGWRRSDYPIEVCK
jgi:rhodanese-related sulfurtransferase